MKRSQSSSGGAPRLTATVWLAAGLALWGGCSEEPQGDPQWGQPVAPKTPLSPRCGDGQIDPGEFCDDGPGNGIRGCSESCQPHSAVERPAKKPDCGDGVVDPLEVCDDGSQNSWFESACAPNCGGRIQGKAIAPSRPFQSGDLGASPLAAIDAHCPPGFSALFSDGIERLPPISADDAPPDWVIAPYTAYRRPDGELVWTTSGDPRFGMRRERSVELWAPLIDCGEHRCPRALTGMDASWQPTQMDDCHAWTSASEGIAQLGDPGDVVAYLATNPAVPCNFQEQDVIAICVEL